MMFDNKDIIIIMFDIKEFVFDMFNINACCDCNNNVQKEENNIIIDDTISNLAYERKKFNKIKTHSTLLNSDEKSIKSDLEKLMEFKSSNNNNNRIPVDI